MAGLKKSSKKKDTTNPNTTLVLFLVFFILLSIILGVAGYYGYDGQNKLKEDAKNAKKNEEAAKLGERYWAFVARDTRLALGHSLQEQDYNEVELWKTDRGQLDVIFKDMPALAKVKEMIGANETELGGLEGDKYKTTYKKLLNEAQEKLQNAQATIADLQLKKKKLEADYVALSTNQENYWKDAQAKINTGNKAALAAAQKKTEDMDIAFKQNKQLLDDVSKLKEKHQSEKEDWERQVVKLTKENKRLAERTAVRSATRDPGDIHALVLDISKGKPLWDEPLGKLTKVDMTNRLVHINLGSAQGVKPELTFMVFGAGWSERAEKGLKGTIEVIRILDPQTSLARITSLYDIDGMEIPLTDPSLGRLQREAGNAMKEGDLLFNLTFGTHVAIAGLFNVTGMSGTNPLDQMRHLRNFAHLLERQGVVVDAYVDVMDGQIKGPGITNKTRYLVLGDSPVKADNGGGKGMPAKEKEGEDKDGEAKDQGAEKAKVAEAPAGNGDRDRLLGEAMQKLRKEAAERGMFIIAAENFLNVIGYRPPRSANDLGISRFRSQLPAAGVPAPAEIRENKDGQE